MLKMTSSALNGVPSDHFIPGRRWKVKTLASSLTSHDLATFGTISV